VTLVLWQGGGITGMFATEAVVGVLNLLWTGTLARRTLASVERGATEEAAPAALRDLRRRVGNYALLSSVALFLELIVGTRSEFFFLNHYSGNEQIAFYSIAFSTVAGLRLIPKALGSSIAPAFATLFGAGSSERIRSGYSRSLRLLLLLTLPLTAAGLALGPELIEEVYGRNYAGAGTPVRILLLAFPVIALSSLATSLLAGFGQLRQPIYANAIAATVDITLAATLIPSLDANGAAIANAAAQAISGALLLFFAARFVRPVDWRPTLVLRIAAVSAGVGLAGWGLVNWVDGFPGVALGAVASIAVFAVLASALGIVADEDATWAEQALGERIGRLVRVCAAG
jgi:O-antigen/teichoic acid export membrane protein